jgi:hypothetical protein
LVDSTTARACLSEHLFRFALGRTKRSSDACEIRALAENLEKNDGSLQKFVLDLVLTPSFRSRPRVPVMGDQ